MLILLQEDRGHCFWEVVLV